MLYAADRLEPLHVLETRVVLGLELRELLRVARGEREQLQHMEAEESLRVEQSELARDERAVVAAVDAVRVVAEPAHERVVGGRDPSGGPGLGDRLAEPEPGSVRHDDVEGVLGSPAERDRVDERPDHVEVVDERAGVRVRQDQRRGVRVPSPSACARTCRCARASVRSTSSSR